MTDRVIASRERLAQAVLDGAEEVTLCADFDALANLHRAAEELHDFDDKLAVLADWPFDSIPAANAP